MGPTQFSFNFRSRTGTLDPPFKSQLNALTPLEKNSISWICSSIQSHMLQNSILPDPFESQLLKLSLAFNSTILADSIHNSILPPFKVTFKGVTGIQFHNSILSTLSTSAIYIYLFLIGKLSEYILLTSLSPLHSLALSGVSLCHHCKHLLFLMHQTFLSTLFKTQLFSNVNTP